MLKDKLNRAIQCQYNHWRRRAWNYLQMHKEARYFVFRHFKLWYTKLRYYIIFGETLDMKHPQSFHAKIFWLSVMYRHPLIMQCADKYRVREYVEKCGLGDILNPLYGVYDRAEQIEFDKLPDTYAIKANKGSSYNFFKRNKEEELDIPALIQKFNSWSTSECGEDTAEYQYAKIPFKLCCEKYLLDNQDDEMVEYQFFCFNGRPDSILVRNDLTTAGKHPFAVSYSIDWKREYFRKNEEQFTFDLPKPALLPRMLECAQKLCAPFPHVRVDFYVINNQKLVFGEMTFSTSGNVFHNYNDSALEQWNKGFVIPKPYTKKDRY